MTTPSGSDGHTCRRRSSGPLVNGVRVDPVAPGELLDAVGSFLECGGSHVVSFCAAHPTTEARRDPAYRELLNAGDLNVPDGAPVAWAASLAGGPRRRRLPGTDSLNLVASWGIDRHMRHYLYGSTPETLVAMQANLERHHPGIQIVGVEAPPFRALTAREVGASALRMREVGADAVWIGLGAPKQDVIGHRFRELEAAPAIFCVGAAFDFIARRKRRAPEWMQRNGLEWVHRLASEPTRLWKRYLVGNSRFVAGVVADRARSGRTSRAA